MEIRGVPVTKNGETSRENVEDIVKQVSRSICHRLPVTGNTSKQVETRSTYRRRSTYPAIIVKFVRRSKREEFNRARNKLRGKTVNDLKFNFNTGERMFVVESMTRANKELFSKGLQAKKDLNYKYIWTSQGKIFMHKEDSSNVIHISCQKDIDTKLH